MVLLPINIAKGQAIDVIKSQTSGPLRHQFATESERADVQLCLPMLAADGGESSHDVHAPWLLWGAVADRVGLEDGPFLPFSEKEPTQARVSRKSWTDTTAHSLFEAPLHTAEVDSSCEDEDSEEDLHSSVALQIRQSLQDHPEIKAVLRAWWSVADSDMSGFLEHDEYVSLNKKIYIAMETDPSFDAAEALACAERDWCVPDRSIVDQRIRLEHAQSRVAGSPTPRVEPH